MTGCGDRIQSAGRDLYLVRDRGHAAYAEDGALDGIPLWHGAHPTEQGHEALDHRNTSRAINVRFPLQCRR